MNVPNVAMLSLFMMANVIHVGIKEVEAKSYGK